MKYFFLILLVFFKFTETNSQKKYSLTAYGGWMHTIAERGPKTQTAFSPVKFVKPVSKTLGFAFDLSVNQKLKVGLEFFHEEYDYGYEVSKKASLYGVGVSSGQLGNGVRSILWKSGFRVTHLITERKRWNFYARVTPSLGYYFFDKLLADTSFNNNWWWDLEQRYPNSTLYIMQPPYQRQGLYFLLKGGLEIEYKLKGNFSLPLAVDYQQGFRNFIIDNTLIQRLKEPGGPVSQMYYTRVNGSSIQWHFGIRYNFK